MATIVRASDAPYTATYGSQDISKIANAVRGVPREFINEAGNNVNEKCIAYLRPLIIGELPIVYEEGMPKHIVL